MASKDTKLSIIIDAQNKTAAGFNAVNKQLKQTSVTVHGLSSAMKTVGTAGAIAFGSLAFMTKGIIAAGANFEQTQIAFETMLGSAQTAKKVLADLSKFAQQTPFELPQLEEASKRLLAYGTTADDLIPTLQMLGDISAGVGMDKLPQLILAFGQVQAATKLTGAELRQFSEAGVPLLGALAAELGKTEAEIVEMVSDGAIGFDTMKAALAGLSGEGGKFFNLMDKQSQSLGGLWSNLKDQITFTARAIGEQLLPYLKPLVEQMIGWVKVVGQFVQEHPKLSAGILVATLAFTFLMAALLPLAIALPGLILLFSGIGIVLGLLATPIVGTIALLGIIGVTAFKIAAQWEDAWSLITIVVASSANVVQSIVESMINFVIGGINDMIKKVNSMISLLSNVPGIGKAFKKLSIPELAKVEFQRFDTGAIYNDMMERPQSRTAGEMIVNVTGNTFLDENTATNIGDLIMGKLKMGSQL